MTLPLIVGLEGTTLSASERAFLTDAKPLGIILFARNIAEPRQVISLVESCRAALDSNAWLMIDQEGGRVARLAPPHWEARPAAAILGALDPDAAEESTYLTARLMADDLHQLGVTVNCWPVLDVPASDGHEIIGDRAFSPDPERVALLGRTACQGLLDGGVLPVIKHIPGHGRARADSHESLPVVDADASALARDFAPFADLADMPAAMIAHVTFSVFDPDHPASQSDIMIEEVIRGQIGFDGLLISDDIVMKALTGTMAERAAKVLAAGCDIVLHCNGNLDEMTAVAEACTTLNPETRTRLEAAAGRLHPPKPFDRLAAEERIHHYLNGDRHPRE